MTVGNNSEVKTYTMENPPLDADFPIRERKTFRKDLIKSDYLKAQGCIPEVPEETCQLSPGADHK